MDLIPRLHQAEEGADQDPLRTSAARGSLRRHLRRDDLPGTGHGGGEPAGRLLVRPGRSAPARDGEKGQAKRWRRSAPISSRVARATNKIPEKKANAIFDLLEKFAGYGFNKSHSAAYGLISYQTAYLKANYPVEFMAGLLSNEINNTDKISIFVGECKRMGIHDSAAGRESERLKFTPEMCGVADPTGERDAAAGSRLGYNAIRYGLAAIKNVGEGAMEAGDSRAGRRRRIRVARGFLPAARFARRQSQDAGKPGQMRRVRFPGRERAELFACIEDVAGRASASHRDRASGQVSLFDECRAPTRNRHDTNRSCRGLSTRRCPTKRSCSDSTSPDIRSTLTQTFRRRKISNDRIVRRIGRSRDIPHRGRDLAGGQEVHEEGRQTVCRRVGWRI